MSFEHHFFYRVPRLFLQFLSNLQLRFQFEANLRRLVIRLFYVSISLSIMGWFYNTLPALINSVNNFRDETWMSFRASFIQGVWEVLITLLIATPLFVLIIVITGRLRAGKLMLRVKERKTPIGIAFLLCLFFILSPAIVILINPRMSILSIEFWTGYTLELLVSLIIVTPFVVLWWLIVQARSLNDTLVAWDEAEVAENDVREIEQSLSFFKWVKEDKISGWYELMEEAQYGSGLCPRVLLLVKREQARIKPEEDAGDLENQLHQLITALE